jgi:hypothetical protein
VKGDLKEIEEGRVGKPPQVGGIPDQDDQKNGYPPPQPGDPSRVSHFDIEVRAAAVLTNPHNFVRETTVCVNNANPLSDSWLFATEWRTDDGL